MKALIQRVARANVRIDNHIVGFINNGLVIFLGVTHNDEEKDIKYLVDKISNLRIFGDENDKMNLSVIDIKGEVLIISQFTLYADVRRGRRPDFFSAAEPNRAQDMYKKFIHAASLTGLKIQEGQFGAMMQVELINDGPVTIMVESESKKI